MGGKQENSKHTLKEHRGRGVGPWLPRLRHRGQKGTVWGDRGQLCRPARRLRRGDPVGHVGGGVGRRLPYLMSVGGILVDDFVDDLVVGIVGEFGVVGR